MTDFLKDCYFNGFCEGRTNFVPTPRYAKKLPAMRHSAESIFVVKYLREFDSICKTCFAHESEGPGVQFNEKTEGRKSRETVPLRQKAVQYTQKMPFF
jgi:hypothetical protein